MSEASDRYYHREREKLIKKLGGECTECGSEEDLHFHHVEPVEEGNRGGGMQHLYRLRKEIDNGVDIELRCKSCHIEEHRKRSDLEPLSSYMTEEIA